MPSLEDLLDDIRETKAANGELADYEDACDAGYPGTFADFRKATRSRQPAPMACQLADEDISF